jgi:hypothetical protein
VGALGTHAQQLERWLGRETVEGLSVSMRDWYGPPIPVGGVPGKVFAHRGGDFRGRIGAGIGATAQCMAEDFLRRLRKAARLNMGTAHAGFSSLSDLIAERTAGKGRDFRFQKVGTTGVVGATNSLWRVGSLPSAGAAAAAAPGGTVPTDATTGAFPFVNPTGGDTQHFVRADVLASLANTLLLYDRLFAVAKTMNSTATEAVTGAPTRYQNTTAGTADSAEGNFLFVECGTVLPATAHNWTVCTYTNQGGGASTLPSLTGNSGNIVNRLDQPAGQFFAPLDAGDRGVRTLTQMQCSAAVATGAIDFVIGHPIAFLPVPLANLACITDGINTAFNLTRVFDDACLAFLEVLKPATGATTYTGAFTTVAG